MALPKVLKWFKDNHYSVPNANTVQINIVKKTASIIIPETQTKEGGALMVVFEHTLAAWMPPKLLLNIGSVNGRKPTPQEILAVYSLKEWIDFNEYKTLTTNDVKVGITSAIITVSDTLTKSGGIIIVNFSINKTPLTSMSPINLGSFDERPSISEILASNSITNWLRKNGRTASDISFGLISDTSVVMTVSETVFKQGGDIMIEFIVRDYLEESVIANIVTSRFEQFPSPKELLEDIQSELNRRRITDITIANLVVSYSDSMAWLTIPETKTHFGAEIKIYIDATVNLRTNVDEN